MVLPRFVGPPGSSGWSGGDLVEASRRAVAAGEVEVVRQRRGGRRARRADERAVPVELLRVAGRRVLNVVAEAIAAGGDRGRGAVAAAYRNRSGVIREDHGIAAAGVEALCCIRRTAVGQAPQREVRGVLLELNAARRLPVRVDVAGLFV